MYRFVYLQCACLGGVGTLALFTQSEQGAIAGVILATAGNVGLLFRYWRTAKGTVTSVHFLATGLWLMGLGVRAMFLT